MTSAATTPEAYIAELDEPRRGELANISTMIRHLAPDLAPFIAYGMLGFGPYHYKYASGREGDGCWIGLSSRKNYISVYVNGTSDGQFLAETYKNRFPKANIGKSCVRFQRFSDLDPAVFNELIERSVALYPGDEAYARNRA